MARRDEFCEGWARVRNGRIWSRKALGIKSWARLFRTTAFKLAIAYFVIVGLGFTLVLDRVGENVRELIDAQMRQTIDAEIKGLADQYAEGGLNQLVAVVERRSRAPGASIYLVAAPNGVAVAGNVLDLPAGVFDQKEAVETDL